MEIIKNNHRLLRRAIADYDPTGALGTFSALTAGQKKEGRVVSIVAVKSGTDITGWDALNEAAWAALVTSGDIVVLGPVTGELPEPQEATSPGDGHQEEISDSELYDLNFSFYNPDGNLLLAEKLNKQSQLGDWSVMPVFYDMTGYIFTSDGPVLIPAKFRLRPASLGNNIGNNRKMMGNVKLRTTGLPTVITGLPQSVFKKN